jgi:dienelactone hydrolase
VAQTAAVDAGRSYDADGQLDVYHPGAEGEWPVVVVFADADRSRADYAGVAASLAVAGSVVVVADYEREVAPIDADCIMRAAFGWAPGYGGSASQVAVVGFGFGAVLAAGETFDGPWTSWSTAHECAVDTTRLDPQVLVTVAGAFGAYTGENELDPQYQGPSPFSQLGGNPYSRIRLLVGSGDDRAVQQDTERFQAALEEEGYDARAEVLDIGDGSALGSTVYPHEADGGAELAGLVLAALDGTPTG